MNEATKKKEAKPEAKPEAKTEGYDFDNFEEDALDRPRDKAWDNFFSWKDAEIGTKVQGYIRDAFWRPAEGVYKSARGITLEQPDGVLVNVTVKDLDFILAKTDNLRMGDPLTIVFVEEKPPKTKGQYGTKIYDYFGKNLPENAKNPTVKELTDQDRADGGTVASTEEEGEEPTVDDSDEPF